MQVNKRKINNSSLLIVASFILVFAIEWTSQVERLQTNLSFIKINKSWMAIRFLGERSDLLSDGIPDGWNYQWWGGATGKILITKQALSGNAAVEIKRTSPSGVIALTQEIQVEPGKDLVLRIYSQGSNARVQFRFQKIDDSEWVDRGWFEIAASENWNENHFSFKPPKDAIRALLLIRVTGDVLLDETFLGYQNSAELSNNLLKNPGFEKDGIQEEPISWWKSNITGLSAVHLPEGWVPEQASYLSVMSFLSEKFEPILERNQEFSFSCQGEPAYTSWLIAQDLVLERQGGLAARERLYQLATQLAPDCPQAFARLANLYQDNSGFWKAAEYYLKAGDLAGESPESGKYYFEAGLIFLRQAGDYDLAIEAFRLANLHSGWERGLWYRGSAAYFLGVSLESAGRIEEALQAYQQVIECQNCAEQRPLAVQRIQSLSVAP